MSEDNEQTQDPTGVQDEGAHPELTAIAESLESEAEQTREPESPGDAAGPEVIDGVSESGERSGEGSASETALEEPSSDEMAAHVDDGETLGAEAVEPREAADSAADETSTPSEAPVGPVSGSQPDDVPWLPFLVYLGLWIVFAGVVIWRFYDVPRGQAVYESPLYPLSVFGGLALTVAGPLLSLATWVAAWGTPGSTKWGQFVSAVVKGSVVTAGGAVLWWAALIIVDQLRLGRVF